MSIGKKESPLHKEKECVAEEGGGKADPPEWMAGLSYH